MIDWIGKQLGNYRLTRLLGQGGFATVYLGEHIYLQTPAAIKVVQVHLTQNTLEKFLTEARTIARLSHPHIIPVLEFGIEQETPFLVLPYAENGSLRERHPNGTILPSTAIVSYVNQMTSALQYAHNRDIIHRDVKPENMLLDRNETLLLSDFGIAISIADNPTSTTQLPLTNTIIGTATYMAPEQFNGKPCPASDQYAMAIMVYEWFSGEPPFGGNPMRVALQHLQEPPPALCSKIPTISTAIEQVVQQALAKEPARRFTHIQDFAQALETACTAVQAARTPSRQLFLPAVPQAPGQESRATGLLASDYAPATYYSNATPGLPSYPSAASHLEPQRLLSTRQASTVQPAQLIYPERRPLSRRKVLLGLSIAGLATAGIVALGTETIWNNLFQTNPAPISKIPDVVPTTAPTATTAPTSTPDATATAQALNVQTIINTTNNRPGLASWGAGNLNMFVRGSDSTLWHRDFDGTWHNWESLGNPLTFDPAAVSWGSGRIDIVVRASDNSLQHQIFDGATWQTPESQGGVLTADPGITSRGPGFLDIFVRGTDNGLWYKSFDGTWHDWQPLGSGFTSAPTAVSWAPGRLDVFVRGYNNDLGHIWFDGSWHNWEWLGGTFTSDPTAASPAPGQLDVYVLTPNNTLAHKLFDGSGWREWESLGGMLGSAPSAVAQGPNHIDIYARNTSNALQHKLFDGTWHEWEPFV